MNHQARTRTSPKMELPRLLLSGMFILVFGGYLLLVPQTKNQTDKDWSHLWLGGRMIVTGHAAGLYDPALQVEVYRQADPDGRPPEVWRERNRILGCFNYPPPAAVAYAALAWMPIGTAAQINACLTLGLALASAWCFSRNLRPTVPWLPAALAFLAYPSFFFNLALGQNAVVTLSVLVGAWTLSSRRWDFLAGLVLGLLVCKPNWLLAVGWIPVVHRRWRLVSGMGVALLSVLAATVFLIGIRPFLDYAQLFPKVAQIQQLPGYALDLKYNATGLFRKWLGPTSRAADACGWASCVLMVIVTWRVSLGAWQPGTVRFHRLMACGTMAALWINPHLNYYDLMPAAACVLALGLDWKHLKASGKTCAVALAIFTYAALPVDRLWSLNDVLPLPSFAIVALWAWFACQLAQAGRGPIRIVDRNFRRP